MAASVISYIIAIWADLLSHNSHNNKNSIWKKLNQKIVIMPNNYWDKLNEKIEEMCDVSYFYVWFHLKESGRLPISEANGRKKHVKKLNIS
jgi:hypothetical protein